MSELLWVAVPSGLDGTDALIRVLVVPRLEGVALSDFGLQEWPTLLESLTFQLRTDTSAGIAVATGSPTLRTAAGRDVWDAFFGGQGGLITDWRSREAELPEVHPTHTDAQRVTHTYRDAVTRMAPATGDAPAIVRDALTPWARRPGSPAPMPEPPIPSPVPPDFHRTVAMLREHPAVLRELGLVFELAVPRARLAVGDPAQPRHVSVRCTDPVLDLLVRAPWTTYLLDGDHFVPASAPGADIKIRHGVVDLAEAGVVAPGGDQPPWAVCTFEVDGAVGRLRDAANSVAAEVPTLPHLRSAGLMLVRPNRSGDYAARAGAARANAAAESMEDARFTADDLVLGYRLDVRTDGGPWRSLTHRLATYTVNGIPIGPPESAEEGHVKAFAAVRHADGAVRADEVVTRWDGWSHAVPARNLLDDTAGPQRDTAVPLPYDFGWRFDLADHVPLPRLRFGTSYQLRVRVADPTGGGVPLDAATPNAQCSGMVLYTRHEPVPPPLVTAAERTFAPGAGVTTLVIRSDHDRGAADLHQAEPRYPEVERRTLHAPPVDFAVAEQHGVFDPPATDEQTWSWAQRALRPDGPDGPLPDPAAGGITAVLREDTTGNPQTERADWTRPWPDAAAKRVDLTESTDAANPAALRWNGGGVLEVRLARGRQATLTLSSMINDDQRNCFSVLDWLTDAAVDVDDALGGLHPQLSPPAVLRVVHAVRRPLTEPRWVVRPDAVDRKAHETPATIEAIFAEDGLHVPSTGQLDAAATWVEWTDQGSHEVVVDHVHSKAFAPADEAAFSLRHEFGDTKHRVVTYTLTAISRFRQYFDAAEPENAFRVSLEQRPVSIPSSARPSAPTVLAVAPAFTWLTSETPDRITRTRLGRRLRVEIAPPWYETGEGEKLAVLTAPADFPIELADSVTQVGRDPLWGTPDPPRFPHADWFTASDTRLVTPPDLDYPVRVVPYPLTRVGDRWCADLEVATLGPAGSYSPFLQLVLARYQAASVRGLELSTSVVTDKVPVLPDRTLVVQRVDGGVAVTLSGIAPHPPNRVEATLEWADSPASDLVTTDAGDGVPAWRPVAEPVFGETNLQLPTLPLTDNRSTLRVRVREVELLYAVGDSEAPRELQERSIFLDIVPLPAAWTRYVQ